MSRANGRMRKELLELVIECLEGRIRRKEVAPETLARTRQVLLRFAMSHGGRPLEHLGKATIDRWAEDIAHLSPGTRRGNVSKVRHFLGWAHDEHGVPDLRKHLPKVRKPRTVPRARTRDEVVKLFDGLPDTRAKALCALLLYPGLRCIEVTRLRVEDYDRGMLRVVGKGGHERVVPVGPEASRLLAAWLQERGTVPGAMFPGQRPGEGLQSGTISHLVARWMSNAGVKVGARDGRSAHSLRHTAASDALDAGLNIRVVQDLLGHASISTTEVYLRPAALEDLKRAVDRDYRAEAGANEEDGGAPRDGQRAEAITGGSVPTGDSGPPSTATDLPLTGTAQTGAALGGAA